jgi:hypothetical protein
MPGFIVTEGSEVVCAHQAKGKPTLVISNVTIKGKAVVAGIPQPYTISACQNKIPGTPVPFACAMVMGWMPPATRVKAKGLAVLLSDGKGTCLPTGVPTAVQVGQAVVKGA